MAEYSIYNLPKLIFFCCFGTLSVVRLLVKSDKPVDSKTIILLVSFARKFFLFDRWVSHWILMYICKLFFAVKGR